MPDDFKLELHTSFMDESEAMALDLIKALESIDPEKKLFEHIGQYSSSKEKKVRWDVNYYEKLFKDLADTASKIWVCGPPIM